LIRQTTATDGPAPSLRPHYRGITATTSRSASAPGNGTHVPTGHSRLGHSLSPHAEAAVSRRAFSRSAREPQTKLTPPLRRTPPGQYTGIRQAHPGTHTIAPVLMSSERVTTLPRRSSSGSLPDASRAPFPSSLTTTVFSQRSMRRLETTPRRAAPGGHQSPISRAAPHQETSLPTHSRLPSAFVTHGAALLEGGLRLWWPGAGSAVAVAARFCHRCDRTGRLRLGRW
jgi:hypothetical protein